ncbi:MAG: hypothetical protein IJF78_12665 [Clostridia bacterium]|nr:hypothetical protein [Clostridia bacterium]
MKLLILSKEHCDLTDVLLSCRAETQILSFADAAGADFDGYDAFCVLGNGGTVLDPRLRSRLEAEADKGKKIFLESVGSFRSVYSAPPTETTRSRLVYIAPENGGGIPGLTTGDLLDDECGSTMTPWFTLPEMVPLLVYREQIIAHIHADMPAGEILRGSKPGMFFLGDNILMAMFCMRNFNRARFAPRKNWEKLITYIAVFLTGCEPERMPEPVVRYGTDADLTDPELWEYSRKQAIDNGIRWLEQFLIDNGRGGIREGLRHNILPDGRQLTADTVRNDCCGEAAGAFAMYGYLTGDKKYSAIAENLRQLMRDFFIVREEPFCGMMRWSAEAWDVCYPDDAARSVIPGLISALLMHDDRYTDDIYACLDFLISVACRDGLPLARYDRWHYNAESLAGVKHMEHGTPSAHYTAYHLAALLLGYLKCGKTEYLESARKGLETLMGLYPDLRREQSETQEMCRLILPLAVLYEATGEEKHREYLYRVTADLEKHRHPFGGYREWDTGYKAACSRESRGECSLLSENGDPVTDSLYSMNWLPVGFACAYHATGDSYFYDLWKNVTAFYMRIQMHSENPMQNGAWCRAFDMDLEEAYGCPHDIGWAANCCETGWTEAEILMGMMLMDLYDKEKTNK